MTCRVTVLPGNQQLIAQKGDILLPLLRSAGLSPAAPCGGNGQCGKCKVTVDGREVLACQTVVDRDMVVSLPSEEDGICLTHGLPVKLEPDSGLCLAIDIGTTTVAAYLTENGKELFCESRKNPQAAYGADVVSRIQYGIKQGTAELTAVIRNCLENITQELLAQTGKQHLKTVCIVGNPTMQQLFLGLPLDNLVTIPFRPVLENAAIEDGGKYIPAWSGAELLIVPDIAGYIGADTVAAVLATELHNREELTLLVDIGTNGEMVLGNKHRMVACATAAGPALEGASIQFGMVAQAGAIDHIWLNKGELCCSVIGGGEATGICGSGIIDAVAAALNIDMINERGRIQNAQRRICLTEEIYLTQDDIRQVQLAKGAIAAGIQLMAEHLGVAVQDIQKVYLAGAFGNYLLPSSVHRIGLLPPQLRGRVDAVATAAGSGAKMLACNPHLLHLAQDIVQRVEFMEISVAPGFQRCFADHMRFEDAVSHWCQMALTLGFTNAVPLNPETLQPRQNVRDMCAADKCGAYGKNWTCPPYCGTLKECAAKMQGYRRGVLLQTVGRTEKLIDTKAYHRIEKQHLWQFHMLSVLMRKGYPNALCLGSGGCRICDKCAYPETCRFPEKACASMEAYGLFVTEVCRDNGLAYHHGEKTITYTACVLF